MDRAHLIGRCSAVDIAAVGNGIGAAVDSCSLTFGGTLNHGNFNSRSSDLLRHGGVFCTQLFSTCHTVRASVDLPVAGVDESVVRH